MSEAGRINHLVRALREAGFYARELPAEPGEINKSVLSALRSFKSYPGTERGRVSKVVNAFRNIAPGTFRGFGNSCNQVTPTLITAVDLFIAASVDSQAQKKEIQSSSILCAHEDELNGLYAG